MSHIDFLIGFVLIISTVSLLIYFVSNSLSNNVNDFRTNEIKESSYSLGRYLFDINDDKSLVSTFRELQTVLNETNHTNHEEEIIISIKSQVTNVKIYNSSLSEIVSTSSQFPGETVVSFTLNFVADEVKRVNIFYVGDSVNDIDYLTPDNNITLRMLSDKEINIVSQEKCSNFISYPYETVKDMLGFRNNFRLDLENCNYGPQPSVGNIVVRNIPVIFESSNGLLSSKFARLSVW